MSTNTDRHTRGGMVRQLDKFLTENLDNPELSWPRISSAPFRRRRKPSAAGPTLKLKVLIVGDLTLELPIEVSATRAQLSALLRGKGDDRKLRWKMSKARVGGFVAHATRTAAGLGTEVSVCTVVPIPTPYRFEAFFEQHAIGKRFIAGLPGRCPVTVVFCCQDGTIPIRRRSLISAASLNWPRAAETDFDVILVDPCHLACREAIIRNLSCCLERRTERPLIGLRLGHQWTRADLAPTHDGRVWSFVRHSDARQLVGRLATCERDRGGCDDEDSFARRMREECGIAKLVLQLGPRGAVLMNGIPCPYHVHTCPMEPVNRVGSGDTMLTVTTLSSAAGADDNTSLRRGVAAATGHVAGLELPQSLEELDVA